MKGRPVGSIIRNRLAVILNNIYTGYGYELFKIYKEIFGKIHIRTIYYNLKKGIEKEEFIVSKIENEYGQYSWGNEVQKIYYVLGPYANINIPQKELDLIKKICSKYKNKNINIDWEKEIKSFSTSLKKEINNYNKDYKILSSQGKKKKKELIENKIEKLKVYAKSKLSENKVKLIFKDINI